MESEGMLIHDLALIDDPLATSGRCVGWGSPKTMGHGFVLVFKRIKNLLSISHCWAAHGAGNTGRHYVPRNMR